LLNIRNNSIINASRIVGLIAALLLVLSAVLGTMIAVDHERHTQERRALMLYDLLFVEHPTKEAFRHYLEKHDLTPVSSNEILSVKEFGDEMIQDALLRDTFKAANIEIFRYKDHYYYAYKMSDMYYFRSNIIIKPIQLYIAVVFVILLLLLFVLYRFIVKGVRPLKKLTQQLENIDDNKIIDTRIEGDDEVAKLANAFYQAQEKILTLQQSRTLFMRNVMHELKTPIAKGKLMSAMLEVDPYTKNELDSLFEQMQLHLNDLAQVELLTAKNLELDLKEYGVVDLVDQAFDLLYISEDECKSFLKNERLNVDFNLFAYALKNLIDNALKYATSLPIIIKSEADGIVVINKGKPLERDINAYLKAFSRDHSHNAIEGMGLGLYIANEIILKHGFVLSYRYENGAHHFKIMT